MRKHMASFFFFFGKLQRCQTLRGNMQIARSKVAREIGSS